jgi:hypothetical protein
MDFAGLADKRLIGVVAAQFAHGTDTPEVIEVWLRLESLIIGVGVAAIGRFGSSQAGQGRVA